MKHHILVTDEKAFRAALVSDDKLWGAVKRLIETPVPAVDIEFSRSHRELQDYHHILRQTSVTRVPHP